MILLDTGPIVAFFDKDDRYHALCLETLKKVK
jgi:predicted nucleic acid-binding protein